jgi:hypothetical protein
MSDQRRNVIGQVWSKLGDCPQCRHKAFLGALMGWALVGLIIAFGDGRQLAMAAGLAAAALSTLWGVHRIAYATRMALARRTAPRIATDGAVTTLLH